jgi:hypothetical protein
LHRVLLPTNNAQENAALCTLLKHGCHFDYWNQTLNMDLCYLDCYEPGMCCYLTIHVENLLHPLQRFYFHLYSIYWLSLVVSFLVSQSLI